MPASIKTEEDIACAILHLHARTKDLDEVIDGLAFGSIHIQVPELYIFSPFLGDLGSQDG
jgi:hypothetical protein